MNAVNRSIGILFNKEIIQINIFYDLQTYSLSFSLYPVICKTQMFLHFSLQLKHIINKWGMREIKIY